MGLAQSSFVVSLSSHIQYPDQVFIFGGGRWARVIAGVVRDLLPINTPLTLCSSRGVAALTTWLAEQGVDRRISVARQWPERFPSGRTAVIVANAARDHTAAGLWALERGASVLIEKPFGFSLRDAQTLADCACKCGSVLVAAHVFRFARYLRNFARMMPQWDEIYSVSLDWADSKGEHRYGEAKQYDSSVPVFVDCLPHAVSVLQSVFDLLPELDGPATVDAGGAKITIPLSLGGKPCLVTLERNSPQRRRLMTVETVSGLITLDFSAEPGVIRIGTEMFCGDPCWDNAPRPLPLLLGAFLAADVGRKQDSRLSLDTAFAACRINDDVMPKYRIAVMDWLVNQLTSLDCKSDPAVSYALAEILQIEGRLPETELVAREFLLRQKLQGI